MERQFEIQIEKLKKKILKMCSLVDEQVEYAIRAVESDNNELINTVIERDNKVDKYDVKIDKICQKIIALNQPVAMDLRLIMSALTINTNLERIGDIAVNIVENYKFLNGKRELIKRTKLRERCSGIRSILLSRTIRSWRKRLFKRIR